MSFSTIFGEPNLQHSNSQPPPFSGKGLSLIALVGIILLATFLRVNDLNAIPPGLHYDEAFNAIQARDVFRGTNRPIFFTGNFGEEPLQMYVAALIFGIVGESPWALRLSSAILGILLVPALWFAARSLFRSRPAIAIVGAFVGGTMYWAINFSRLGIETNSLPVVLTLSAGALALANARGGWKWPIAAGILVGGTLYTYLASRLWLLAPPLWFVFLAISHWKKRPALWRPWLVIGFTTLVTMAPLVLFFISNPLALTGRSGQVLTPNQITQNAAATLGMFSLRGDLDPRDNLPGRPALDVLLSVLFAFGLLVSVARARKPSYAMLLIWLVIMTVPSTVTEFAPNFRRAIGAMPALAIVCGVGADQLLQIAAGLIGRQGRYGSFNFREAAPPVLLALGLLFSAWSSATDYFSVWAKGSGLFYSFDVGLLKVANLLAARPAGEQLCLSPDYHAHPTVLWALEGRAFSSFDGRQVTVLPNSAQPATCAIITWEDLDPFPPRYYPAAQTLSTISDYDNSAYAKLFSIPERSIANFNPEQPLDAQLGRFFHLLGYDLARMGEEIDLTFYWRAEANIQDDFTFFVHLVGPPGASSESGLWSQADSQPGRGTFPTSRWRAGQVIIDRYTLKIPPEAPSAVYQIEVGMYLLSTGQRLPVVMDGQLQAQDRLILAKVVK